MYLCPCCADVSFQDKSQCFLWARKHRWLEEARSSYRRNHPGVRERTRSVWPRTVGSKQRKSSGKKKETFTVWAPTPSSINQSLSVLQGRRVLKYIKGTGVRSDFPARTCLGALTPVNLFKEEFKLYIKSGPDWLLQTELKTKHQVHIWRSELTPLCPAALRSPTANGGSLCADSCLTRGQGRTGP